MEKPEQEKLHTSMDQLFKTSVIMQKWSNNELQITE